MKPKTVRITYWVLVIFLCLFTTFDAIGGITKQQAGIDVLNHLGYPIYIMPLLGVLKLLGVIALLQTKFVTIKEWVFAGLTFIFIGACISHICSHDAIFDTLLPLIFLAFTLVTRSFSEKYQAVKNIA